MPHRKLRYKRKPNSDYVPFSVLWSPHLDWQKNAKLLLLELLFAKQLTKVLVDTAVAKPSAFIANPTESDLINEHGMEADLARFLPGTVLTRLLEPHLIEVLFHKYWQQYHFFTFSKATEPHYTNDVETDDITNVHFRANKENLHQISPYISKLDLIWMGVEIPSAVGMFFITRSVGATLGLAAIIEFVKRFRF
jgi:hypothetical protein